MQLPCSYLSFSKYSLINIFRNEEMADSIEPTISSLNVYLFTA
jgi:hypothetical protein